MPTGSILFPIQSAKLPSTTGAQVDGGGTNWTLLFDDTTQEYCRFQCRLPANYSDSLVAKVQYSMTSAVASSVQAEVFVMAITPGDTTADADTDSFGASNAGLSTVPATSGDLGEISITLSNTDAATAGDYTIFQLTRNPGITNDAVGDLEVRNFVIEFNITS